MGTYRLTEVAKADLKRIYLRGLREFGEGQADRYYSAFFDRFEQLADQPTLYPAVDDIREGYRRSICGMDRSATIKTFGAKKQLTPTTVSKSSVHRARRLRRSPPPAPTRSCPKARPCR